MVLQSFSSAPPPTMAFNPDREKGSVDRAEYEWWECLLFEVPKGTRVTVILVRAEKEKLYSNRRE